MRAAAWALVISSQVALVLLFTVIVWIEFTGPVQIAAAQIEPMTGWRAKAFAAVIWLTMLVGLVATVTLASGEIAGPCR